MEYYNEIAEGYDELYKKEQLEKLELIKSLLKQLKIRLRKDYELLDVGCGTGISTHFWGYTNADRIGIDPAEKLIKIAQHDLESQYFIEKAENIPFDDNSFDLVTSITAIQNFQNIEKALKEINRVAKKIIILTFLKKSPKQQQIIKLIKNNFKNILLQTEQEKDLIFIIKK